MQIAPPDQPLLPGDNTTLLILFWNVQFEILEFNTDIMFIAALSLCPHEMKASALICRLVLPEKANPAGHVHMIVLVTFGREEGLPSRVREGWE